MLKNGLLTTAKFIQSDHYDLRPKNTQINLLVIHCASLPEGEYNNNHIEDLFTANMPLEQLSTLGLPDDLRVSSHLYIKRNGEIIQFVNFNHRAWHAGVSTFEGIENCNNYSIGIELQGAVWDTYTPSQYTSLINVTLELLKNYPLIYKNRIVGHSHIAPERKSDPGEMFNWDFYLSNV